MKREAFTVVGNPLMMGGPVLFSRVGGGGGGGSPIDATNPANLPLTSVVTIQAYIHAWNSGTNVWEEGVVVFFDRSLMPFVINRGQPDERVYNSPGTQFPVIVPAYVAGLATMTFEDRLGNIGAFNLLRPTLLEGEFRPASSAYMTERLSMTIDIAAWEIGDSYQLDTTSLTSLNAIGEIRVLDNAGSPGSWLVGAAYSYFTQPEGDQETAHWNGTAWVEGAVPSVDLDAEMEAFLDGRDGYVHDFHDNSVMWQEFANTLLPVTAPGQPVGRMNTKWGKTTYLTGGTSAARLPLWQTDRVTFDGVDDTVSITNDLAAFTGMEGLTVSFGFNLTQDGGGHSLWGIGAGGNVAGRMVSLRILANGLLQVLARAGAGSAVEDRSSAIGAVPFGVDSTLTLVIDYLTGNLDAWIDGVQVIDAVLTGAAGATIWLPNRNMIARNSADDATFLNGAMQRFVLLRETVDAPTRQLFEAWVGE